MLHLLVGATSLSVAAWTRASVCLGVNPMHKTSLRRTYLFHSLFLGLLDSVCEEAGNRKEDGHRNGPDKCTPAKDVV